VEIVGLSYACLKRLSELNVQGVYSYNAVERFNDGALIKWKLSEWAEKIRSNFESHYFVRRGNLADKRPDLINKEGIYKDTLNSELPWTDYQLRCNFPIAMAVAPDLFDVPNAWNALQIAKEKLLGPLGMATLDPDDWSYRGDYDNSNDSEDPSVSHGSNYHQGPEWVWPVGYFLRAYLTFAKKMGGHKDAKDFVMAVLSAHFVEIQQSHWRGIPELTNKNGKFCAHSNPIQAWSMSCLLEVLFELDK
jgi:glycogen debranching enzyme